MSPGDVIKRMHQQFRSTWCEIPDYFANVVRKRI